LDEQVVLRLPGDRFEKKARDLLYTDYDKEESQCDMLIDIHLEN